MKVLLLFPRLDIPFKDLNGGYYPEKIGEPNHPLRFHWQQFGVNLLQFHMSRGDLIEVSELPLWKFNAKEIDDGKYDLIYVPHKDKNTFPIKKSKVLYYMQTVFPQFFTVDPEAWGPGLSFVQKSLGHKNKDGWVFSVREMEEPVKNEGFSKAMIDMWFNHFKAIYTSKSKFDQPNPSNSFPYKDYALFICQIPHDEIIKLYSQRCSVENALLTTIQACKVMGIQLLVKGHPANPGSMEPLKEIVGGLDNVKWLSDANIHDCLQNAKFVVTCNSGVGFEAILHEKPIITFGNAEYNKVVPSTTTFWSSMVNTIRKDEKGLTQFKIDQYREWLFWFMHQTVDSKDLTSYNILEKHFGT